MYSALARHGDTLNNCRVAKFSLEAGRRETEVGRPMTTLSVFFKIGKVKSKPNCTVTLVLKAMDNDWSTISSLP
ncbi:hypothetical protein TNCV_2204071 [Trichonephila clavipes]|nr:hypothetical protein TNCV_2204071 [Trichonephila clavipes]